MMPADSGKISRGFLFFLILLFATILGGGWMAAREFLANPLKLSPEELAEQERFFTEPIELPEEWQVVEPFPSDLIQAASDYYEALADAVRESSSIMTIPSESLFDAATTAGEEPIPNEMKESWAEQSALRSFLAIPAHDNSYTHAQLYWGEEVSEEDWAEIESKLEQTRPILDAASRMIEHPSYEMEAVPPNPFDYDLGPEFVDPDTLTLWTVSTLIILKGHLAARDGDWEEAWKQGLLALRAARRHPASESTLHMNGHSIMGSCTSAFYYFTSQCPSKGILESVLSLLNELDRSLNPGALKDERLLNLVADSRRNIRRGANIDLTGKIPAGDFYKSTIGEMKPDANAAFSTRVLYRLLGPFVDLEGFFLRIFYQVGSPFFESGQRREKEAEAQFDILRLAIANRILELEGDPITEDPGDFAPRFFEEVPVDPFTGSPYLWDASNTMFYSMGPDGVDDLNEIPFDSSTEKGDLSLIVKKPEPRRQQNLPMYPPGGYGSAYRKNSEEIPVSIE